MNQQPTSDERLGKMSASGAERFVNCAGSHQAEQGLPELPTAAVTQDGTDIHEAMETGDTSGLDESEEQIVKRLEAMEKGVLNDWMEAYGIISTPERQAEQRLWIRDRNTLEPIASAKLDTFYIDESSALLVDFKSGYKRATASERNWQLLTQAIALWHEFPHVIRFRVAIAASRLSSTVDVAEYESGQLAHAERELQHALWRANQPNPPRTPGSWCQYCRAKNDCITGVAYASIVLHDKAIPKHTKIGVLEAVQHMTPEQLAYVFQRSKIADMIFDSVKDRLKAMPAEALEKIGIRLKPGAKRRTATNLAAVRDKLLTILSSSELDECLTLSVTNTQKAIGAKKKLSAKGAGEFIEELLGELIETKQNSPSLEIIA